MDSFPAVTLSDHRPVARSFPGLVRQITPGRRPGQNRHRPAGALTGRDADAGGGPGRVRPCRTAGPGR